jgi:hypothetical protein
MASLSTYVANKLIDHSNGVAPYTPPTVYIALIRCSAGQSPRSTAVTSGQTTAPAASNGHMYRCTSAGTTGSGEPSWPTISAGTVSDGTVVWTEMTPDFQANNSNLTGVEANYTGYARAALSGLMGAASAGSSTNTTAINLAACTGGTNTIGAWCSYDALTTGNLLKFAATTNFLVVSNGITPSFPIGDLTTAQS